MSGKYYSRVYEGDFKNTESWIRDFKQYTAEKSKKQESHYLGTPRVQNALKNAVKITL